MYEVYVLRSRKTLKYYIGHTADLKTRLTQHNYGGNKFTKKYRPWVVVYTETFETKSLAWEREQQIKSYKGGRAFKALLK